jgi:catechol 2,3-dioxygenase-like lactoylglutathione lyase family enzyme
MMFDHIGIKVSNLPASSGFYRSALEPLGVSLCAEGDGWTGFGIDGAAALYLYSTTERCGGTHLAFSAKSRALVDRFHRAALKAGGSDNGPPGLRSDYSATYYAAFVHDPDGNNVEVVCLKEKG